MMINIVGNWWLWGNSNFIYFNMFSFIHSEIKKLIYKTLKTIKSTSVIVVQQQKSLELFYHKSIYKATGLVFNTIAANLYIFVLRNPWKKRLNLSAIVYTHLRMHQISLWTKTSSPMIQYFLLIMVPLWNPLNEHNENNLHSVSSTFSSNVLTGRILGFSLMT